MFIRLTKILAKAGGVIHPVKISAPSCFITVQNLVADSQLIPAVEVKNQGDDPTSR